MVAAGDLEIVAADVDAAAVSLEEARLHLHSAAAISSSDPNGAYQLAYDAARKAVMSSMRAGGFRVRKGEGGHAITASYAAEALDQALGKRFDSARRRRNRSEYGSAFFDAASIADAIDLAGLLIAAVESEPKN